MILHVYDLAIKSGAFLVATPDKIISELIKKNGGNIFKRFHETGTIEYLKHLKILF